MVAAVCSADEPAASALTLSLDGGIELSREPLRVRDRTVGVRHSLMLRDGARIRIDRIEPEGILRRVVATYAEPSPSGHRPVLLVLAGGACNVMAGRRLVYDANGMQHSIEHLESNLERTVQVEPLNPPVPTEARDATVDGGVRVAHVDSGVDYRLPRIASRLARDPGGALVGFDFWDLDRRPFDANPAHSPFHPQRHGTRTASLILEEAPVAVLVPYRYPRHDMSRMPELVEHAVDAGARIMNISMGSRRLSDWTAFEAAARSHPEMLFVVSAGNNGVDIDETPVWPAALALDNLLTVTSSDASGLPARGSNWGRESIDLAVPAEEVPVTGFDGRVHEVSGSSYAAARVSALAACLLAAHPEWTTQELRSAILDLAEKPASDMVAYVSTGTLRDPTGTRRGACEAEPSTVAEVPLGAWTAEQLYPDGEAPAHAHTVALDVVFVSGAGWRVREILRAVRRAAAILAQCEVAVNRVRLRMIETPPPVPVPPRRVEPPARATARPVASRGVLRRGDAAPTGLRGGSVRAGEHASHTVDARHRLDHPSRRARRGRARARAVPRAGRSRPARDRSRQPHERARRQRQHPAPRLAMRAAAQGGDGIRAGGAGAVDRHGGGECPQRRDSFAEVLPKPANLVHPLVQDGDDADVSVAQSLPVEEMLPTTKDKPVDAELGRDRT